MIKATDAIRTARGLLGTPYSEMDCIGLIKRVIRRSPGGVKDWTTAGTNTLWDSAKASAKYRDLTWRQEGIAGVTPGMLAFKRYGADDEGHVGLVTERGTVIHASSEYGETVETTLTTQAGWDLLARHRYIEVGEDTEDTQDTEEGETMEAYKARVALKDENEPGNYLKVRNGPFARADKIGEIEHGAVVTVQSVTGNWAFVQQEGGPTGYVHKGYLERIEEEPDEELGDLEAGNVKATTLINDEAEQAIVLVGRWRVAED